MHRPSILFPGIFVVILAVTNINCGSSCKKPGDSPGGNPSADDTNGTANFEPDNTANVEGYTASGDEVDPDQPTMERDPSTVDPADAHQNRQSRQTQNMPNRQVETAELSPADRTRARFATRNRQPAAANAEVATRPRVVNSSE